MRNTISVRSASKREYWSRQAAAWKSSGVSQAQFARQEQLKVNTFRWWLHRLEETDVHFVEVPDIAKEIPLACGPANSGVRLRVAGVEIHVGPDFNEGTLRRVVTLLRESQRCS